MDTRLVFESDYTNGAHPEVLEALVKTNMQSAASYGDDEFSASAKQKIRKACDIADDAPIYFIAGGTQTNLVVISSVLNNYEGAVTVATGHINGHEAGAIELSGHKVMTLPHHTGKLDADELDTFVGTFYADANHEHMVFPALVYISHPTEYGTLYTKKELTAIRKTCDKYGMKLYLDGARLAYGLASRTTDVTLEDIAKLCDIFYIGGTKCGALAGEALVFPHGDAPAHFMTQIKQRGALLAKGRITGVQFDALFTDGLYFNIGKNAIDKAEALKELLERKGYQFFIDSPTNQQFIVAENKKLEEFSKYVRYGFWEKYDDEHTVIRLATSWSTTDEDIEKLAKYL